VEAFTDRELRNALGRFATGVTVVTTMTRDGPLGITVNSFSSVSLDPPLVLWSPARKSTRFPAFEASSHFAIHVLAADQQPLAEHFARDGDFGDIPHAPGIGDAPLLDGAVARLECLHAAAHDGGDHLIVVGEVLRITETEAPPLLFHRGRFLALP
jgi:flavin reductase (DIM6/NTAB) family NADH-FMN oxidoreductase RutF